MPRDLVAALRRLADELAVPLSSVLLAAHAKVLAALSGEREVGDRLRAPPTAEPLPCRLSTEPGLVADAAARTPTGPSPSCWRTQDFPVDDLRRRAGPGRAVVRDRVRPDAAHGTPSWPRTPCCGCGIADDGGGLVLRLRYRTDVLDADCAARIAGYHLAALALIAADPDAEHGRQSLLSAEELRLPARRARRAAPGAAGPPVPRAVRAAGTRHTRTPSRRSTATGSGPTRELNARANRLARALLARGLRREGVVAVVTERNLDWMAAVLAVFKAGGVYLPIEPHFPADRIATTLSRAECGLVLTETGSTGHARHGPRARCPGSRRCSSTRPTRRATPTATSASTSRRTSSPTSTSPPAPPASPRARCASTRACSTTCTPRSTTWSIGEGQVVAQTAPQCFDISLWQLVSALLVGGRTLLVEQEVILDVERFVDTIVDGRVAVLQVVPSYLEVVLSYLEQHPRDLPDLRCVSVTGEALKKELAQRWFAAKPDDQAGQRVRADRDLGRHQPRGHGPGAGRRPGPARPAVNNVHVYVVDEHLSPVPLGAPGEIVFSGICVGRGYVNDPERTRRAFMADPHRPGQRLYRGGDYGRWLPGRQAGVPRPPRQPGQDQRVPDRDRRDREHAAAGARRPRRRRGGRRAGRPAEAPGGLLRRGAAARGRPAAGPAGRVAARVHGPVGLPLAGKPAADRQRQDRQEDARRRSPPSPGPPTTATRRRPRRPSGGSRPRGRRCSASRRTRSAGRTTSSTGAARRCRRSSWRSAWTGRCR